MPKEECPDIWIRIPPRQSRTVGIVLKTPWFDLTETFVVTNLSAFFGKSKFEEVVFEKRWEKVPTWECLYVLQEARIILIRICPWFENGWKEATCGLYVENSAEISRPWKSHTPQ